MNKLNFINSLKGIIYESTTDSLFKGVDKGMVHYKDNSYKLSHPVSDLDVLDFNLTNGYFKVKGNFVVGVKEGTIKPHVLKHIVDELNKDSKVIKFPLGGNYGDITMTMV